MLTPSFHFSILKDFLTIINHHARHLQEKLQMETCDTNKSVDAFPYITLNSLDIICGKTIIYIINLIKELESNLLLDLIDSIHVYILMARTQN